MRREAWPSCTGPYDCTGPHATADVQAGMRMRAWWEGLGLTEMVGGCMNTGFSKGSGGVQVVWVAEVVRVKEGRMVTAGGGRASAGSCCCCAWGLCVCACRRIAPTHAPAQQPQTGAGQALAHSACKRARTGARTPARMRTHSLWGGKGMYPLPTTKGFVIFIVCSCGGAAAATGGGGRGSGQEWEGRATARTPTGGRRDPHRSALGASVSCQPSCQPSHTAVPGLRAAP